MLSQKKIKEYPKRKRIDFWIILKYFNLVFSYPAVSAMTGFGVFWYYRLSGSGVFVSMLVGLFVSALVSRVLPVKIKD